jgi:adenylate cyclase class 2
MSGQETEIKFYIHNLPAKVEHLRSLGAQVIQSRVYERNLRFDTPYMELSSQARVLRLRQDTATHLTYKGPGQRTDGVISRREIEFEANNFRAAKDFIEALGFEIIFLYEKYRAVYELEAAHIMVDELPYGNFLEIEAETHETIRQISDRLELAWERAVQASYSGLFTQLKEKLNLPFRDLSFENFQGQNIQPADLGVRPADE